MSRSGLTGSVQRPHQERQIASRRLNQELFVHVLETPDIKPVQTTRVKLMREVSLDPLPPLLLQVPATIALYASPVGIHRSLLYLPAAPVARSTIRLGHVGPHTHLGQFHHHIVAVISLVRYHFFHALAMHLVLAVRRLLSD